MTENIHLHGGFPPTVRLTRRDARRVLRRLEKLIPVDPDEPVGIMACLALGAWRRLHAGERDFSPQMWAVVEQVLDAPASIEPSPVDHAVRELSDAEAMDLTHRSIILHGQLATGHFRYVEDQQNIHALLISEGVLGMLEFGHRRFVGVRMLGYIDTVGQ